MKLLLTSGGITNKSIAKALFDLIGKKPQNTTLVFIPTAANVEAGNKGWLINDLVNLKKQNFKVIDIIDISALPKDIWLPRIKRADVLFFEGGNTTHLMYWIKKSGLIKLLPNLLKTKVWVGVSAGSIVTNPALTLSNQDKKIYYEENFGYRSEEALGLVDFYIRPHLNSSFFPHASKKNLEKVAKEVSETIYGIDDNSAIKVVGNKVKVVSEGEWVVFNKNN